MDKSAGGGCALAKNRIPIPREVVADVLFAANRTCCKCNVPGKQVQIHHIDDDPSNNAPENLAVLCFECHNETLISGGFGRTLDAEQIRRYRDDWNERMRSRRAEADRLATEVMAPGLVRSGKASFHPGLPLQDYVNTLPDVLRSAYAVAQPRWDTGVTAEMVEANYAVIDVLQDMLASLAMYYPAGHFDTPNPRDYISEVVASRFKWHRYHHEPDGQGKNGTIVNVMVGGAVMDDAESMVEDMVRSLTLNWEDDAGFKDWRQRWEAAQH